MHEACNWHLDTTICKYSFVSLSRSSTGIARCNSFSRYSRDLHLDDGPDRTTHLIVASPHGDKYDSASRPEHADKIAIVGAQWLLDCEERGELLDTGAYKLSRKKARDTKDDDDDGHDIGGMASLSVGEALDQLLSSPVSGRLFSRCQFCLLGFDEPKSTSRAARKRGSDISNGIGGDERAQLKGKLAKLIRKERGTILWELSEHVTHLIVADDCGDSIRRAAVSFALQLQGPMVVAPRWVVTSCSAQRLLLPTKYLPQPRAEEMIAPKTAAAKSQVADTRGDGDTDQDGQHIGKLPQRSSVSSSQKIRSSLFKGAIFAFVRPTPPEWAVDWMNKSEFEECITAHGGCTLTQPILSALRKSAAASISEDDYSRMGFGTRSRSGAPLTDRACYIVSSGGYPQDQNAAFHPTLGELMKENLCKIISVTPLWIKTCIAEKRDVNVSHFPYLFQPQLHHVARLPSSVQITVAVSGFVGGERTGIRILLEAIGATYTDNMSKRNTHLISKATSGPKYTKALEWGIKVVNVDWLCHITKHGYSGERVGGDKDTGDETKGCEVRFSLSDSKPSATQETISASYATEASGRDLPHQEQVQREVKIPGALTATTSSATSSSVAAKKRPASLASPDPKEKKREINDGSREAKNASPGEHKMDAASNCDVASATNSERKATGTAHKDSRVSSSLIGLDEGIRPMLARAGRRRRDVQGSGRGSQESLTPKQEKANEDHDATSRDSHTVDEGGEPLDQKSPIMSSPSSNQKQAPDLGAESQMIWYEGGTQF